MDFYGIDNMRDICIASEKHVTYMKLSIPLMLWSSEEPFMSREGSIQMF